MDRTDTVFRLGKISRTNVSGSGLEPVSNSYAFASLDEGLLPGHDGREDRRES
jgi:hypothetical protein